MYKNKYRILVLSILLLTLSIIILYIFFAKPVDVVQEVFYDINKRGNIISKIKQTKKYNENIIYELRINDNLTYYNDVENTYYYYVESSKKDTICDFNLKVYSLDYGEIKYIINSEDYFEENKIKVNFKENINIIVYSDNEYFETNIKFINIPILNIEKQTEQEIGLSNIASNISLYGKDPSTNNIEIINSNSFIRKRGNSSIVYPKASYRLSLYKDGEKNKKSLLGMRDDEDWILDSLYSDESLIRSKLGFDIWNEINSYTKNTIDNDIKCEYVVVYINNVYEGLYLLKEPVDKKTVKLDADGALLKGNTYVPVNFEEAERENVMHEVFELKYPSNVQDSKLYWDNITSRIYPYYFERKTDDLTISNTFDIYSYVDYQIFVHTLRAIDNYLAKNVYLSLKNMNNDTKVICTPWDLDVALGKTWTGLGATQLENEYHEYDKSIEILKANSPETNKVIIDRYKELRQTVLSKEHINELIDSYITILECNEGDKNNEKWININFKEEAENIREFLLKRIDVFDAYIGEYDV